MNVPEVAAIGFTKEADAYERGRPDYPQAAVDLLLARLPQTPRILDLAAGTGKFTRMLARTARAAELIAVEPLPAMRAKLAAALPEVTLYEGTAEAIPLPDASVELVTVAQAFHWFDGPRALKEIRRVLRPGGTLALIWNARDERLAWVRAITALLERYEGDTPRYAKGTWRRAFETNADFTALEHHTFDHKQSGGHAMIRDRLVSISFIAALPSAEREVFMTSLREILETHPETRARAEDLELPYRTSAYLAAAR